MNDVALVDEPQADPSADGSRDVGIRQLEVGVRDGTVGNFNRSLRDGDGALVRLNGTLILSDGGVLGIRLLCGNEAPVEKRLVSCRLQFCRFQQSLVPREIAACLRLLCLCLSELSL